MATTGTGTLTLMGSLSSACSSRHQQEVATEWGVLALVGVLPSPCGGRGWHVGRESVIVALSLVYDSTMVLHFQGRPRFLQEHSWPWGPSLSTPQVVSVQLSSSLLSLQAIIAQPTAVLSLGPLS